jgi:hypothetical protein
VRRDRVVSAGTLEGPREVCIALGQPQAAGVGVVDEVVEDRASLIQAAGRHRLLERHADGLSQNV